MRLLRLAFALLALVSPLAAQRLQIKLDPSKTRIEWTLGDVLHTVHGTFQLKSGTILFDPRSGDASGQVIVDAASGNSGNKTRDSKMNREVLETSRYPEVIFSPRHVSGFVPGQEAQTVQVSGSFTIHGGGHDITLTMPVSLKNSTVEGHTDFTVPYDAWGMKNPSTLFLKVEKTVQISVSAVGELQSAASTSAGH